MLEGLVIGPGAPHHSDHSVCIFVDQVRVLRDLAPAICTASNNLSSHLLLVAWSADATVRIGDSNGFRCRAAERVTLELGPRSEQEIRAGLEKEVDAERWTSLDRSLRAISDEGGGIADLRPGGAAGEDPELRRLMLGRAAKLERLGLAEQVSTAQWTLKPGIETALRDLGIRGDIIKTMHRAMSATDREPDVASFALHGSRGRD